MAPQKLREQRPTLQAIEAAPPNAESSNAPVHKEALGSVEAEVWRKEMGAEGRVQLRDARSRPRESRP